MGTLVSSTNKTDNHNINLDFDIFWYKWFILQDVLTDLKADAETLPLDPIKEDWVGHKVIYYVADAFILVSHGEVYSIQHYVMKLVSDLWQVGSFLR
jgi:hypothetical protein